MLDLWCDKMFRLARVADSDRYHNPHCRVRNPTALQIADSGHLRADLCSPDVTWHWRCDAAFLAWLVRCKPIVRKRYDNKQLTLEEANIFQFAFDTVTALSTAEGWQSDQDSELSPIPPDLSGCRIERPGEIAWLPAFAKLDPPAAKTPSPPDEPAAVGQRGGRHRAASKSSGPTLF